MIVRSNANDPAQRQAAQEFIQRAPEVIHTRFGDGWEPGVTFGDQISSLVHRILHPFGIHWDMWIEEIDFRDAQPSTHGSVQCGLCHEKQMRNGG